MYAYFVDTRIQTMPTNRSHEKIINMLELGKLNITALAHMKKLKDKGEVFESLLGKYTVDSILQKIENLIDKCDPNNSTRSKISKHQQQYLDVLDDFKRDFGRYYTQKRDIRKLQTMDEITHMILHRDYKKDAIERLIRLDSTMQEQLFNTLLLSESREAITIELHYLAVHCLDNNLDNEQQAVLGIIQNFEQHQAITIPPPFIFETENVTEEQRKDDRKMIKDANRVNDKIKKKNENISEEIDKEPLGKGLYGRVFNYCLPRPQILEPFKERIKAIYNAIDFTDEGWMQKANEFNSKKNISDILDVQDKEKPLLKGLPFIDDEVNHQLTALVIDFYRVMAQGTIGVDGRLKPWVFEYVGVDNIEEAFKLIGEEKIHSCFLSSANLSLGGIAKHFIAEVDPLEFLIFNKILNSLMQKDPLEILELAGHPVPKGEYDDHYFQRMKEALELTQAKAPIAIEDKVRDVQDEPRNSSIEHKEQASDDENFMLSHAKNFPFFQPANPPAVSETLETESPSPRKGSICQQAVSLRPS